MTTNYKFRVVPRDPNIKDDGSAIIDSLQLAADKIRSKSYLGYQLLSVSYLITYRAVILIWGSWG